MNLPKASQGVKGTRACPQGPSPHHTLSPPSVPVHLLRLVLGSHARPKC